MSKLTSRRRRNIELGRVVCPLRGEIDVDTCVGCDYLREVVRGGKDGTFLVCRPPVSALPVETHMIGLGW